MNKLYIIGSLRNPEVPRVAEKVRRMAPAVEVFDDWFAAGPTADDSWRDYEKAKGRSFREALDGHAAKHVFEYDKQHLDSSNGVMLVAPAGKSAFLELGYAVGCRKWTGILLDNPDRWDVMFKFATCVSTDLDELMASYARSLKETQRHWIDTAWGDYDLAP